MTGSQYGLVGVHNNGFDKFATRPFYYYWDEYHCNFLFRYAFTEHLAKYDFYVTLIKHKTAIVYYAFQMFWRICFWFNVCVCLVHPLSTFKALLLDTFEFLPCHSFLIKVNRTFRRSETLPYRVLDYKAFNNSLATTYN